VGRVADLYLASTSPGAIRGNHYHLRKRQALHDPAGHNLVVSLDEGEGTTAQHRGFDGSTAVLAMVPAANFSGRAQRWRSAVVVHDLFIRALRSNRHRCAESYIAAERNGPRQTRSRDYRPLPGWHYPVRIALPQAAPLAARLLSRGTRYPWWAIALSLLPPKPAPLHIIHPGLPYDTNQKLSLPRSSWDTWLGGFVDQLRAAAALFSRRSYTAYELIEPPLRPRLPFASPPVCSC